MISSLLISYCWNITYFVLNELLVSDFFGILSNPSYKTDCNGQVGLCQLLVSDLFGIRTDRTYTIVGETVLISQTVS